MNIQINSLTNANVYIDGVGLLGRAEEVEIPQPRHKMIDYKGLGMVGTAELWSGVDKLEAKIKWVSFDAETLTMAASPFQTHSFQVRGSLEQYTSQGRSAELPVVYLMTGSLQGRRNGRLQATSDGGNQFNRECLSLRTLCRRYPDLPLRRICERLCGRWCGSALYLPNQPGRLTQSASYWHHGASEKECLQ